MRENPSVLGDEVVYAILLYEQADSVPTLCKRTPLLNMLIKLVLSNHYLLVQQHNTHRPSNTNTNQIVGFLF